MITVQLVENGPITEMDEAHLEKREGLIDNENEHTTWVEYWLGARCVHRSAHVRLKRSPSAMVEAGRFR